MGVLWGIASRFQTLGMNLSLSSNNILQLFLISFHIGVHFNAVPCPSWGMNLFLPASVSNKYSCENPWPSEDPMIKKNHTLRNILKFQNVKFKYLHSYIWILIKKILRLRLYLLWMKVIDKYNFFSFFTVTLRVFIKYQSTSFFPVTQHHEKPWDSPTPICDVIVEQLLLCLIDKDSDFPTYCFLEITHSNR